MINRGRHMHIDMGIDASNDGIRVATYDGHCHPSSLDGQGWHALAGRVDPRPPDLALTGPVTVSRPTGECRPQGPLASHSKDNPRGVSRFASQAKPRELTNRSFQPRVTAIDHDQRTPTSSLPDMGAFYRWFRRTVERLPPNR